MPFAPGPRQVLLVVSSGNIHCWGKRGPSARITARRSRWRQAEAAGGNGAPAPRRALEATECACGNEYERIRHNIIASVKANGREG